MAKEVGAGGSCLNFLSISQQVLVGVVWTLSLSLSLLFLIFFSLPLGDGLEIRQKYGLKRSFNPRQQTKQPFSVWFDSLMEKKVLQPKSNEHIPKSKPVCCNLLS